MSDSNPATRSEMTKAAAILGIAAAFCSVGLARTCWINWSYLAFFLPLAGFSLAFWSSVRKLCSFSLILPW